MCRCEGVVYEFDVVLQWFVWCCKLMEWCKQSLCQLSASMILLVSLEKLEVSISVDGIIITGAVGLKLVKCF